MDLAPQDNPELLTYGRRAMVKVTNHVRDPSMHVRDICTATRWILLIALAFPLPAPAAGFTCTPSPARQDPPSASSQLTELEEVFVTPARVIRRQRDLGAWLKRLEGQYSYEGYVDLCGQGNAADQRQITGKADCIALAHHPAEMPPSGVYCVVDVRWPQVLTEEGLPITGGTSTLAPAVLIYGAAPDLPGIHFIQIDSEGIATSARGQITGDTLVTKQTCHLPPGTCQKVTRVRAAPGSDEIQMLIDIEHDSQRVLRHNFLLRRVSNIQVRPDRHNLLQVGER